MVFAWILVLVAAMVHTRATNKLKRAKKKQKKGEFVLVDDSETESIDWDELEKETSTSTVPTAPKRKEPASSKAKTPPTTAGKGKNPMPRTHISMKRKSVARKKGRARGIEIREPSASDVTPPVEHVHLTTERSKAFENRECIGERHVNIETLRARSTNFGTLIDKANLYQICKFSESTGFCLYFVRTFYTNARQLQEIEDGPMEFYTSVRGTDLKITPQLIGEVLGMTSSMTGTHFLEGTSLSTSSWRTVVDGICIPNTQSTGHSIYSKELRTEYRFLNFVICYNILPNLQTKVLRWDRFLFLYLLGHSSEALGLNINIPYTIWNRMVRYVKHPHQTERLPFPLIIMRILRKFKVDTHSSSYQHSQGTIDDSTVVKSLPRQLFNTPTPPSKEHLASTSARPKQAAAAIPTTRMPTSDDGASSEQERILKEQQRISQEFEIITAAQITLTKKFTSIKKLVKKMFTKMGCSSSDDSDSEN